MADLAIFTGTGTGFKVTCDEAIFGWSQYYIWPDMIFCVHLNAIGVGLKFTNGDVWDMTWDGANGSVQVTEVTGTTSITSNTQLLALIVALKG